LHLLRGDAELAEKGLMKTLNTEKADVPGSIRMFRMRNAEFPIISGQVSVRSERQGQR
jgi:hypothetical protein